MKTVGSPVLLLVCCLFFSCDSTEPPPPPPEPLPTITLTFEDVGVTEAWLRVSILDTVSQRLFTLMRDGQPVDTTSLASSDTVLHDGQLAPNSAYTYRAYRLKDGVRVDSTDVLPLTTLDTTSHEFTWEMFEFGDGLSDHFLADNSRFQRPCVMIWAIAE